MKRSALAGTRVLRLLDSGSYLCCGCSDQCLGVAKHQGILEREYAKRGYYDLAAFHLLS